MKKVLAGVCLWLAASGASATGFDFSLSDNTANLALLLNPSAMYGGGGSELSLGAFVSEDDDHILHATLMARGYKQTQRSQYNLAAGMKIIGGEVRIVDDVLLADADKESVGALALGMQAGLLLRQSRYYPMELAVEGFYAPSITSFSDATRYAEFSARFQVEVIPSARAYVGYRRMRFNTNDYENVRLDRSVHVGLKFAF